MRRGGKSLNDFKFGTSIGRFWSDGASSTVAKGLIPIFIHNRLCVDSVACVRRSDTVVKILGVHYRQHFFVVEITRRYQTVTKRGQTEDTSWLKT